MAANGGAAIALKDNLVAHWSLEAASGTRVDDFSTNDLTSNNSVGTAAGKIGQAAAFVAASSQYLSIADNAALSMGDIDFTVGAWVYLDSKGARRPVISKNFGLFEFLLEYFPGDDRFRFWVSPDGSATTNIPASAAGSPSPATWYFVVAWHDSVANTINIQVNNGTINSTAHTTGVFNGTSFFAIGGAGFFMDGRVDQPFVTKRVLTAQERTDLYNGGSGLAYSQWPGTYTLSGSASTGVASGSGTGLVITAPISTLSGSATAAVASGAGTGLTVTAPVYSLSGAATAGVATGSGAGLAATPPLFSLSGSGVAQPATGSGVGLSFIPLRTLSGFATAEPATGSGAGLVWGFRLIRASGTWATVVREGAWT